MISHDFIRFKQIAGAIESSKFNDETKYGIGEPITAAFKSCKRHDHQPR
jgi:hypothetical protein